MVLTFTGSMGAATAGRTEIREMLVGAIGCNLAWGLVDAVMYLMQTLLGRGRGYRVIRQLQSSSTPDGVKEALADAFDPYVASLFRPLSLDALRRDLMDAAPPVRPALTSQDLFGAIEVFLLVFLSTFPVVIPFLVMTDALHATRMSNGIAVTMLCAGGYSLGRYSGLPPWRMAVAMAALGIVLVAIAIALGG
jgi:VIT1/CCC1 family predicted Fe2+/Mn2+ transporter